MADFAELADPFALAAYRLRRSSAPKGERGESRLPEVADAMIPQSPMDWAFTVLGGPFGRSAKLAAMLGGAVLEPSEAEGGALNKIAKAAAGKLRGDYASRMQRADEMGFRRDYPLEFSTAPEGERIVSAAVKTRTGDVVTGDNHPAALMAAEKKLGMPAEELIDGVPMPDGFLTSAGRFVSRHEAHDIAQRSEQLSPGHPSARGLTSVMAKKPGRAVAAADFHTGATAEGLPGGQGVWGRLLEGQAASPEAAVLRPSPNAAVLLHRADQAGSFDAAGLADHEIRASIAQAWDNGFDAVMLKNYTRPGGKNPETVIVVRDPTQLRSPDAAFDPKKRNSADLLAGTLPFAVLGGSGAMAPSGAQD